MHGKLGTLIVLNTAAASRVSPAIRHCAARVGWRVIAARRPSDGRLLSLLAGVARGPVVMIADDVSADAAIEGLAMAFAALARQGLVLGPCEDGGYWLCGIARRRRVPGNLFNLAIRPVADAVAEILAKVPMRLWQVELLPLEDFPRLRYGRRR
jgi:glycosyltransferase A (GT-A) superfamily protein (DUF2064 family)